MSELIVNESPPLVVTWEEPDSINIEVEPELPAIIIFTEEQGPPGVGEPGPPGSIGARGPKGDNTPLEMSDLWTLSEPLDNLTLSKVPKSGTVKFFHNGLKQSSTLFEIEGTLLRFNSELEEILFAGDQIELVYTYED